MSSNPISHVGVRRVPYFQHYLSRKIARLQGAACRSFYKDRSAGLDRSVFVAGAGRSGATWLARVIATQLSARIVFEPFLPEVVPEFAAFHHYHFARPGEEDAGLADVVERVLTGKLRNQWTDKLTDKLRPEWRVVKDVRACLMLRWIHDHFPAVPIVYIIRHPCAVVASRIALRWPSDGDIEYFLQQPKLCADFLDEHMDLILSAETDEEKHAVIWCITNLVPLSQFSNSELTVVSYEDLATDPRTQIPRLFEAIGQPFNDAVFEHIRRPSTTSARHSSILNGGDLIGSWRDRMHTNAVDRVLNVVDQFGLSELYAGSSNMTASNFHPRATT